MNVFERAYEIKFAKDTGYSHSPRNASTEWSNGTSDCFQLEQWVDVKS